MKEINKKEVFENINPKNFTFFLLGAATSIMLITGLTLTGTFDAKFMEDEKSINKLSPNEVGEKTVEMLNKRVLHNTPNNVTGKLVEVKPAKSDALSEFYEVVIKIENPTTEQDTTVYVKKDASLVFLNHPRYFDLEKYRNQQHQ